MNRKGKLHWVASLALVSSLALTGCSSDPEPVAAGCADATAREVQQNFITNSQFDVDCVKAKLNAPFYFVNNDDTSHTVTTDPGAPEAFDAELPQKDSTYSHTFTRAGTYSITCKRHNETLTVIVV